MEKSEKQNILKLRREKDEFADQVISLKKEIDFLNCQLKVSNILFMAKCYDVVPN